jgi:large subunit ribosomal protein L22
VATAEQQQIRTEVRAEARWVRTAPRKAALVVDQIRGRPVSEARTILRFMTRDAARDVERVLASAVANAETNHGLVGDDLVVSSAYVGSGPTLKRWRARARGRVARIKKRTCHITVKLSLPDARPIPEPRGAVTILPQAEPEPEAPETAAEEPQAEEAPTPKRTRAAKPTAETAATEEQAEKPKPKRAAKPKAEKPAAAGGEEKPKSTRSSAKKNEEKES